ncbi:hypothetical protein [Rheinheimera sp. F8]|nr:hypothetical protein [Rheinheimera sp. F8]
MADINKQVFGPVGFLHAGFAGYAQSLAQFNKVACQNKANEKALKEKRG